MRWAIPKVDTAFLRVRVDGGKFSLRKVEILEGGNVLPNLLGPARPDERRGDAGIAQYPSQSHLGETLAARICDLV